MAKGFLYLVAIIDWYSRKVLAWRLSNTMDTSFCIEALEEALKHYGPPDIFNSHQGSQFTSTELTHTLIEHNVRISMDGKGHWVDNVFIERLWRNLKYEEVYLKAYTTPREAELEIGDYMVFYNEEHNHQGLYNLTSELIVSQKVKVALLWLKELLESKQISYQIVGGLAAKIHGGSREVADIDIYIHKSDVHKILVDVSQYISKALGI